MDLILAPRRNEEVGLGGGKGNTDHFAVTKD